MTLACPKCHNRVDLYITAVEARCLACGRVMTPAPALDETRPNRHQTGTKKRPPKQAPSQGGLFD